MPGKSNRTRRRWFLAVALVVIGVIAWQVVIRRGQEDDGVRTLFALPPGEFALKAWFIESGDLLVLSNDRAGRHRSWVLRSVSPSGDAKTLATGSGYPGYQHLSPDEKFLVYWVYDSATDRDNVFVVNTRDGSIKQVKTQEQPWLARLHPPPTLALASATTHPGTHRAPLTPPKPPSLWGLGVGRGGKEHENTRRRPQTGIAHSPSPQGPSTSSPVPADK